MEEALAEKLDQIKEEIQSVCSEVGDVYLQVGDISIINEKLDTIIILLKKIVDKDN